MRCVANGGQQSLARMGLTLLALKSVKQRGLGWVGGCQHKVAPLSAFKPRRLRHERKQLVDVQLRIARMRAAGAGGGVQECVVPQLKAWKTQGECGVGQCAWVQWSPKGGCARASSPAVRSALTVRVDEDQVCGLNVRGGQPGLPDVLRDPPLEGRGAKCSMGIQANGACTHKTPARVPPPPPKRTGPACW